MQGLVKKEMGAVITQDQQVYYFHSDVNTEGCNHNDWVEFTVDENRKAHIELDVKEEQITEELLLEEEE
jgi:hypothetical protein